ncbi:MAG: hypothetical protein ACKOPN_01635, partial [Prochlorococcaceae cyanobacterium]
MPDPDWLRWEVRLVHAETGLRIVHVRAHSAQGQPLGSALGEGDSAESAEASSWVPRQGLRQGLRPRRRYRPAIPSPRSAPA